jgi:hypothetical protein
MQPNPWGQPPQNPYQAPNAPTPGAPWTGLGCPRCGSAYTHQPTFTWWGGILGPKLLNHTICNGCHLGFNARTGKDNTGAIAIYFGVVFSIVIFLVIVRAML